MRSTTASNGQAAGHSASGPKLYWQWGLDIWLLAMVALAWGRTNTVYTNLPPRIATNFGGGGQPQGWSTTGFWSVYGVLLAAGLMTIGLAAVTYFIGRARDPMSLINMPGKEKLTLEDAEAIRGLTINMMAAIRLLTVAMFVHMQWYIIDVALRPRAGLGSMPLVYGGLIMAVTGYAILRMFLRLRGGGQT